nr:unnamed protein product [Callosobruchus analis]
MVILNNGDATRIPRINEQKSAVDVTLVSAVFALKCNWQIIHDTLGSDHLPILIDIEQTWDITIHPKSKWNTKLAKWDLYRSTSELLFSEVPPEFANIEQKYQWFLGVINKAAEVAIPIKKPFKIKKRPPPAWWDLDCERAITERKVSLDTYKAAATLDNYLHCRKAMAKAKKILNNKARNGWRTWVSNLNKNTSGKELWQQAKIIQRTQVDSSNKLCTDFA